MMKLKRVAFLEGEQTLILKEIRSILKLTLETIILIENLILHSFLLGFFMEIFL